ncbi:lambda-crystallin homolog [Nephila pilipes]|uniref:Lambda-crystallin homolog n=1 Tax=Nephila pilipes TaxID=299642 RepID=A0A8X6QU98_NEPPI|nr:lambda-crystallin homolog [Nephila pilipes]
MSSKGKVGIVGSGFIGRGWAMLFASVGYEVKLFDVESSKIDDALADIKLQLNKLEENGYLRGYLSASEQFSLISRCDSLKQCVADSIHVQVTKSILALNRVSWGRVRAKNTERETSDSLSTPIPRTRKISVVPASGSMLFLIFVFEGDLARKFGAVGFAIT